MLIEDILMTSNTKFLLWYVLPLILYAIFIFQISTISEVPTIRGILTQEKLPKGVWTGDDIEHIVEYGIFAFLSLRMFKQTKLKFRAHQFAILLTILYGATDELHQLFVPERTASIKDLFFDALASLIVLVRR